MFPLSRVDRASRNRPFVTRQGSYPRAPCRSGEDRNRTCRAVINLLLNQERQPWPRWESNPLTPIFPLVERHSPWSCPTLTAHPCLNTHVFQSLFGAMGSSSYSLRGQGNPNTTTQMNCGYQASCCAGDGGIPSESPSPACNLSGTQLLPLRTSHGIGGPWLPLNKVLVTAVNARQALSWNPHGSSGLRPGPLYFRARFTAVMHPS